MLVKEDQEIRVDSVLQFVLDVVKDLLRLVLIYQRARLPRVTLSGQALPATSKPHVTQVGLVVHQLVQDVIGMIAGNVSAQLLR